MTKNIKHLLEYASNSDESSLEETPSLEEEKNLYKRFRNNKYGKKARKTPSIDDYEIRKRFRYRKSRKG